MLRHAVCDQDGRVVNVVIWDGETPWYPHDQTHYVVRHDKCDINDNHIMGKDSKDKDIHWFEKSIDTITTESVNVLGIVTVNTEQPARKLSTDKVNVTKKEKQVTRNDGTTYVLKIYS